MSVRMSPHDAENVLKQSLARLKYLNPDATRRDAMDAIKEYRGLHPQLDTFVFNDGSQKELVCLRGTVPVAYKGVTYNIPVCVWLLETHPLNAPMCYVTPTSDMQVQVSRHVDHTGKVYLPYLHEWSHVGSDLLGLVQVMIITFAEQPPVYARPQRGPDASSAYPRQANPGFPTTPYPAVSAVGPASYPTPAPYPQQMTQPGYPPYPAPTSSYQGYPPPPPPPLSTPQPPYPTPAHQPPSSAATISEEHIRASLLSAVEDKVRRRLQERFGQAQAELDTLRRTQSELSQGKQRLDGLLRRLAEEQVELDKSVGILRDKLTELQEATARLQDLQPIPPDEAITTTAPLYKQLLGAFAEEAATEDAIYYLDEGLRRGVLELDVFLKHVRSLSRRQFMLRALMLKCRQRGGLAA